MEGISLIGLPLLELLEELVDVLVFELATELDDRSERIWCEGGGGGAIENREISIITIENTVSYFPRENPRGFLYWNQKAFLIHCALYATASDNL